MFLGGLQTALLVFFFISIGWGSLPGTDIEYLIKLLISNLFTFKQILAKQFLTLFRGLS